MSTIREAIEALATALGLDVEYVDNWGVLHRTNLEGARRFLAAKGVLVDEELISPTSEVLVASEDTLPVPWSFWIDTETTAADVKYVAPDIAVRVIDEEGTEQAVFHSPSNAISADPDLAPGRVLVSVSVPSGLRPGSYRVRAQVRIRDTEVSQDGTWIVCPERAHVPEAMEAGRKIAGVGLALYGVRSARNWGIGDFSDLKKIIEWAHDDLGVDFVGLNPLHALFNRHPFNISPYLPSSRIFRNFIYLDVEAIEDFRDSPAAMSILSSMETQHSIQGMRNRKQVNYEEVADLKLRVLREVFRTFMENHGYAENTDPRWADFETYIQNEGEYLKRFAAFCALEENFRQADRPVYRWQDWPEEFRDPSSAAVERFCADRREAVLFWKYLQWQVEKQLAAAQQYALDKGMLLGLYHDEALGVDRNGADFWCLREFYHEGFSVGAPPDAFAPNGQDWGFALPNRDKIRAVGYEPFLKHLRSNCKYGGALRLDHVMQLGRLFWIPSGTKPADGFYVGDYESDLVNLLTLESKRNKVLIVGEDLGTVPFAFRERLMSNSIFSYRLFYFERDAAGNHMPFHAYPENALVSISTHDLPTLAGFWSGRDIDERIRVGQLRKEREQSYRQDREQQKRKILDRLAEDGFLGYEYVEGARNAVFPTDELQSAVLRFLFHTPSRLVMINQEDIFLDVRQQNIPGTTWEHPNWVTKMLYTVDELRSDPVAVRLCRKFRGLVEESGRLTR